MNKGMVIWTLLVCCIGGSMAAGATADDYITAGRAQLFQGTISGVEDAYQTFDAGLNDPGCPDCATSRELTFLHALTKTLMLFVDYNDVVVADSFFELAEEFGVTFTGTTCEDFNAVLPIDVLDCWVLPADADPDRVGRTLYDSVLPQVDSIITELDTITDTPRFRMFFTPAETGLEQNLEVDYGEVLILKGLLLAYKSLLAAQIPYDLNVQIDEALLDSYLADNRVCPGEYDGAGPPSLLGVADPCNPSINTDFLQKYPYLLMVLPTPNDPNNGAAILAQARVDIIDGIDYWLDAIDYIKSEDSPPGTDPQDDELVYLDPNALLRVDPAVQRLTALRDSLQNRTAATYVVQTSMTYNVYDVNAAPLGELVLIYDFTGVDGEDGWFTATDGSILEVDWVQIDATNTIEIDLYSRTQWLQVWIEGTISADRATISNATVHFWGDYYGTLFGVTAQRTDSVAWTLKLNPNPLFGTSPPVHPRDLLPQFADDNEVIPGTFGHGLGDDPTLGGIVPEWYQEDWSDLLDIPTLVYRFWSPTKKRHFYTIITPERDKLISKYPHVWTYERVAYFAYVSDCEWGLSPVYRFWSDKRSGHFYTISETERDKLINQYSHVWTFEGGAFYAYPAGIQPPEAIPVWRFWSNTLGTHFYTVSESEKNKLISSYSHVWEYEGVAWYVDN